MGTSRINPQLLTSNAPLGVNAGSRLTWRPRSTKGRRARRHAHNRARRVTLGRCRPKSLPNLAHEAFAAATHFATRTNTPRRERAS